MLHNISPVYDKNSEILILGSFPSVLSREERFFYAHPQNRFWTVLSAVLECDTPHTVDEKKKLLLKNHIALWDVVASCEIKGSSDSSIANAVPNDISVILKQAKIENVFVNGRTAEKYYNRLVFPLTHFPAVYLPSTSPANAAMSKDKLINAWRIILSRDMP